MRTIQSVTRPAQQPSQFIISTILSPSVDITDKENTSLQGVISDRENETSEQVGDCYVKYNHSHSTSEIIQIHNDILTQYSSIKSKEK